MKFYSLATIMTITASAAHAATKVSGEDHDAHISKIQGRHLRHLLDTDDMDSSIDMLMSYGYEDEDGAVVSL